jgi:hypothetical protein
MLCPSVAAVARFLGYGAVQSDPHQRVALDAFNAQGVLAHIHLATEQNAAKVPSSVNLVGILPNPSLRRSPSTFSSLSIQIKHSRLTSILRAGYTLPLFV